MVQRCMVLIALVASVGVLLPRVGAAMSNELEVEDIREGKPCDNPTKTGDSIYIHYSGKLHPDLGGTVFESTKNKKPHKLQLGSGREIKGWELGLLEMCPGARRRLTVPPSYGYDAGTKAGVPAGATVVFDMEMVSIEDQDSWTKSWAGVQIIVVFSIAAIIWTSIWKGTSEVDFEPRGPKAAYKKM